MELAASAPMPAPLFPYAEVQLGQLCPGDISVLHMESHRPDMYDPSSTKEHFKKN